MSDKLEKTKELLKLINDGLTKKDFIDSFRNVVEQVNKVKAQQEKKMQEATNLINSYIRNAKDVTTTQKTELKSLVKNELTKLSDSLNSKMEEVDSKLSEVKDGMDGQDADENRIIEAVKEQITIPTVEDLQNDIPKLGEPIRDALELLQGEERLDVSAIKGLDKLMNKDMGGRRGGGGFSYIHMDRHFIDRESVGTGDGATKVFTLNGAPNPTNSLRVVVGGGELFETDDFTLSSKTITFITAPPSGAVIRAWYRK